jgi:hypothetical protein
MQVQFASTPQDANVLWMRRGYTHALQNLAPHQTINHLPNERALIDKSHLARGLQRLSESLPGAALPLDDFYPKTFCLETGGLSRAVSGNGECRTKRRALDYEAR